MKLFGIIIVDFGVTILIRYFALIRYWRKNGSTWAQLSSL